MSIRKRILTGHRPTGPRHIGHLVGTLINWKKLQSTHECFFLVADLHVLTTDYANTQHIPENTIGIVTDWLAAGIDPNQAAIILQSAIPEHGELSLYLNMLTTVSRLQRIPTYKEQMQQLNLTPSAGFLNYPVLQAADILLYKAQEVPVGEDQLPHIELTREAARRFNQIYGYAFPEPEALLSNTPRLPGIDNRTMHTSYHNAIFLRDTPEETHKKVMRMYTDPTRLRATDPGHVEGNPVFAYLDIFDPDKFGVEEMKTLYQAGKIGDVAVKKHLAKEINAYLAPIRAKRKELGSNPKEIVEILQAGTDAARPIAQASIEEVREKMHLNVIKRY